MSSKNPIIAVTGSSGAGTSTTTASFEHIFRTLGITSVNVEGDSFHRFSRQEMDMEKRKAKEWAKNWREKNKEKVNEMGKRYRQKQKRLFELAKERGLVDDE